MKWDGYQWGVFKLAIIFSALVAVIVMFVAVLLLHTFN